ncbi:glycerophosphoryl diester phosphodiesterase [Salirhabdus euzebyi]|uniref:Glycerophosphoryl diester phosphodiesterase n=1 Tax=Salirhabdus euzebyi TaxID=394506 RepID=A0A841Q254_9BACI|nr:glycerophosphoryl diester phosphodiesterase [Salirhabdus euzebyi]
MNADVYKIGFSYSGMAGMLFISFLSVLILLVEFGVIILIAQQRYFHKNILISQAFITTLRRLPKLIGFGIIQLILLLLLIIPFFSAPNLPALLDFNVPIFLTSRFYAFSFSLLAYIVVFLAIVYFVLRFIFTLHYLFIDGLPIRKAMKSSWKLTKKNKGKTLIHLILLNIIIFLTGFLFMTFISFVPSMIEYKVIASVVENYFMTFSSYMMIIFSLLIVPINMIIITRLFYLYKRKKGIAVQDKLTVHGSDRLGALENKLATFFTKRKYLLIITIMLYITTTFLLNYTVNNKIVYLKWDVAVAGHRGDVQTAPENSISGIKAAVEKGVDVVEIDVKLTKDGVVILNHDMNLKRVAGVSTNVKDMTYEELAKIDIGAKFSEAFIGEKIPTLDEAMEVIKEENVEVIIDVKSDVPKRDIEFARRIVDIVEQHEMADMTYIQSFSNEFLQEVRATNSEIKIGQIMFLAAGNLGALDVDFYTINQSMLSDRFIKNAKRHNREVWVWTVNIERNMKEVLKYDIDGIITDYPEKVHNVLGIEIFSE